MEDVSPRLAELPAAETATSQGCGLIAMLKSCVRLLLTVSGYAYLFVLITVTLLLNTAGDIWWPATVLLFAPRWIFLFPLVPLLVLAFVRPRLLAGIVVVAAIATPFLGFNISMLGAASESPGLRVMTCNCDFNRLDADAFAALLVEQQPDVIALQGLTSKALTVLLKQIYHVQFTGELCLASRYPIANVDRLAVPEFEELGGMATMFIVKTDYGELGLFNVHFKSPRAGLTEVIEKRWQAGPLLSENSEIRLDQARLTRLRAEQFVGPLIVLGDFNTPVESRIYRREFSHYSNAFIEAGFGFGNTHFTNKTGVRIDHILLSDHWSVAKCWVGSKIGADHQPVFADLILREP